MRRRGKLFSALVMALVSGMLVAETHLTPANDLATEADAAARMGMPLVIVFSRTDCRYCDSVKRDYLKPLQNLPAYRGRLVVREIGQDRQTPLLDFHGNATTHALFAARERIRLVPVVAFYGPDGISLAPPIIGTRLPDFYQSDLDSAIDQARDRLKQR